MKKISIIALILALLMLVTSCGKGEEKKEEEKADETTAAEAVKIDYAREFRASLSAASATTMFAYEIARQNF